VVAGGLVVIILGLRTPSDSNGRRNIEEGALR
jgi:hypothetical protein